MKKIIIAVLVSVVVVFCLLVVLDVFKPSNL